MGKLQNLGLGTGFKKIRLGFGYGIWVCKISKNSGFGFGFVCISAKYPVFKSEPKTVGPNHGRAKPKIYWNVNTVKF
jgi:hypothetical protein